ncbi:MAG TPA: hypothetical protein VGW40_11565 [Allosphingosinicella sp.]|nr:hypothetical protein [Allosphingosinicella sp.]
MENRRIEIDLDVHRAIEGARRALGESENDILRRLLLPARAARPRARPAAAAGPALAGPRSRGLWSVEICGRHIPAANLKDAYRVLLRELGAAHPDFLAAFAEERTFGRRFVARSPAALYGRSPHLARHAQALGAGWWFDSNLSAGQVARRARIAARLCGLHYGSDVRILDNLREI